MARSEKFISDTANMDESRTPESETLRKHYHQNHVYIRHTNI
ncbi:MAG: hypothetical protein J07HQW2_01404 [Haloquadratum walsbyi J07HQW2]|uniref:Uncharacterized protein n=1 Tax=Haloquadratum walsbyi J07HQW2 TaxID=1238425 RepID=U1PMK2_9EURY|nr:MAG: hypothetical protein J07HQW2_01404 [Haloquadratum walsbyi J07HQW2]